MAIPTNQQTSKSQMHIAQANKADQLQAIKHSLVELKKNINDIDQRLESWGTKIMEVIGLDRADVTEDQHLSILPNDRLSRNDLLRKRALLQDRYEQLSKELSGQYAVMRQLKLDREHEKNRQESASIKQQNLQIIAEYKTDPSKFLALHTLILEANNKPDSDQIYATAEQLIAVCEWFNEQNNIEQIWKGWKIVAKARNLAAAALDNFIVEQQINILEQQKSEKLYQNLLRRNEQFSTGAKQYFKSFTNILAFGLQGLRLLYNARDFDRVEYYLNEASNFIFIDNKPAYLQLLTDLATEIHETCMRNARQILDRNTMFNELNKEQRAEFIRAQAYAIQLRFDLSYLQDVLSAADFEIFNQYSKALDDYLHKQLNNPIAVDLANAEFAKIKLQITQHASDIRRKLLPGTQLELPQALEIGSGLGLGWLYGVTNIKVNADTIKLPDSTNDLSLAEILPPKDFDFITEQDKFWNRGQPTIANTSWLHILKHFLKYISKQATEIFAKPEKFAADRYAFNIPKNTLLRIESIAPGFGVRLETHFKRRAENIRVAIEQARNFDQWQAANAIEQELNSLEADWQKIINAAHNPEKFSAVVELYFAERYAADRTLYIDAAKDLKDEKHTEQERNKLLFQYHAEAQNITELHDLKYLFEQVIRPDA